MVDPDGDIGSYTWQVGTTSGFTTIIASGFTNIDSDPKVPTRTAEKVSGLPNGTYFWRVKATQLTINGGVDSPWSAVRTFTVTGPGAAPATPAFISPANNAQFHLFESYKIQWSAVAGAQYYVLEADDEPTFSYPLNLTLSPITFGTQFGGDWGNALTVYYRIRAVSVDGIRSLPSATLTVKITDAAPAPAAVSQLGPAAGATVATPFFLDWSDAANPQIPGYEVNVNTSPTFSDISNVLLATPTRSDYMITADLLAPGSYFWRVRPLAGDGVGPWSPGRAITVTQGPMPPDVGLFAILSEPINGYSGNSVQARVMLDNPAPAGGAVVTLATDLPQVQLPVTTVTVPAGKTDATITPIATGPVPNNGLSIGIIGDLFAGFSDGREQSSLGVVPILFGTGLSHESVVGGTTVIGTVNLLSAAPPGGITVRLISSDTTIVQPPATVFIPAGATGADVSITTSPVSVAARVTIDTGTELEGYRAPQASLVVTPPGAPAPAASLSSLELSQSSVLAGATITGTVTLTSPAPAGGALVTLSASMEGQVITPASVTVPAGSMSATFTTTPAPQTVIPRWVLVQAHYGTSGGTQARVLEIDPAPGEPRLLAIGPASQEVIGGNPGRASVALVMPAPAGGAVVSLSTDNPSVIQVPATVAIPEGNSAVSFTITTSPVIGLPTGGNIFATAGGVTKSVFITVTADPNAPPLLQSLSITPSSLPGGTAATGTVVFSAPAPAGGTSVTLSTSNRAVATVPGIVTVPGGQTSATFTVTTFPVTADTSVTISAFLDATRTATVLVTKNGVPPGSLSSITLNPSSVTGGATSQATVTLSSGAPSGGAVVTLTSSDTAVATVPSTVTISAGKTSATATVTSKPVTTTATASIKATYDSVTRSAILTVNPGGGGTLPAPALLAPAADARFAPGVNITFDWTDVSGAATYTIQIDDQDGFTAPFIVEQTVTTSQFGSSSLPVKTMWFRARANNASGNPGSWSAIRRFEVKN